MYPSRVCTMAFTLSCGKPSLCFHTSTLYWERAFLGSRASAVPLESKAPRTAPRTSRAARDVFRQSNFMEYLSRRLHSGSLRPSSEFSVIHLWRNLQPGSGRVGCSLSLEAIGETSNVRSLPWIHRTPEAL